MPSRRSRRNRRSHSRRMRGGNGFPNGGSWATAVYGSGSEQTSVGNTNGGESNLIKMAAPTTCAGGSVTPSSALPSTSVMTGGGCGLMPQPQSGGNMVDTVAVPAVLLAANQFYKRKQFPSMPFTRRPRHFKRRFRGSRRFRK